MAGQRSVSTRVDAIEHQLQHVQALANATAKGFGKDKVQRQWVVFAQGEFRARLEEAWGVWKEGAGRVRSEGGVAGSAGSADKPQPFKVQVFGLVREQLGRQGLAEDVCQGLAGLRAEDVVESLGLGCALSSYVVWTFGQPVVQGTGGGASGGQAGRLLPGFGVATRQIPPG